MKYGGLETTTNIRTCSTYLGGVMKCHVINRTSAFSA